MDQEFGQFAEWDEKKELEWFMLGYPAHRALHDYVRAMNHTYLDQPALWEIDDSWAGFGWLEADRSRDNVVIFNRYDTTGDFVTVIINFSPVDRKDYVFPTEFPGKYRVLLNSDLYRFGGKNFFSAETLETVTEAYETPSGDIEQDIFLLDLPANSALILKKIDR